MKLTLAAPPDFHFLSAVCSHGFFVLAPNTWHPPTRTLSTTITLDDASAVRVSIRQGPRHAVIVQAAGVLTAEPRARVRAAVRRMLRLDEDLSAFHDRCRQSPTHGSAAEMSFGRLIRSASLFEDIVKVICTCNVTWRQTAAMIRGLVENWGVSPMTAVGAAAVWERTRAPGKCRPLPGGRGSEANDHRAARGFPSPARLAGAREAALKLRARVGYRARFIRRLARDVADGRLDLAAIERFDGSSDELHKLLKRIEGVGDYAAGHLCMLLGRYDRLAVDTEMARLFKHRGRGRTWTAQAMRAHYEGWRPYQFLAYWFDLWQDYVGRHGQADQWWPASIGERITTRL